MYKNSHRREFAKHVIDQSIRAALETIDRGGKSRFRHLLWNVQSHSELLRPGSGVGQTSAEPVDDLLRGLLNLSRHSRDWLRQPEDWRPAVRQPDAAVLVARRTTCSRLTRSLRSC